MSMTIQLDGSALDRLFPPGSQARLDLTAAVVNNFVDKLGIKKLQELPAELRADLRQAVTNAQVEVKKVVDEVLVTSGFVAKSWLGDFKLTDKAKQEVEKLLNPQVNKAIKKMVEEQVKELTVDAALRELVLELAEKKMSEMIGKAVNAALKAKFA